MQVPENSFLCDLIDKKPVTSQFLSRDTLVILPILLMNSEITKRFQIVIKC